MNQLPLPIAVLLFFLLCVHPAPVGLAPRASAPAVVADSAGAAKLPLSKGVNQKLGISIPATAATESAPAAPAARLAVWVEEPARGEPVRGTVVFLHGFMATHHLVTNAAEALRKAGYRSVLVDMRGFGESTGSHMNFGVTDAQDMQFLVTSLQARGLCGPTVGVYGTSMGAATAILWAGIDARVTSVVAVAPYADIRSEVPSFARSFLGGVATVFQDQDLNLVGDLVATLAQWDLDSARPVDAITRTSAPILLIHGDTDAIVPYAASEQLHAAAPAHSRLMTMHNRGHLDLCFDIPGELQGVTREWFDETLMAR